MLRTDESWARCQTSNGFYLYRAVQIVEYVQVSLWGFISIRKKKFAGSRSEKWRVKCVRACWMLNWIWSHWICRCSIVRGRLQDSQRTVDGLAKISVSGGNQKNPLLQTRTLECSRHISLLRHYDNSTWNCATSCPVWILKETHRAT